MYSTSINFKSNTALKSVLLLYDMECSVINRVYSCNGIIYIILNSVAFQSYV